MATIGELFGLAVQNYQSGNAQQAETLCRQVLQGDPAHDGAHHMLGVLELQAGRHEAAMTLIRRAIALNPMNADCHFNLGIILMGQGHAAEAIACYRQALRVNPYHDESYNNLGNALRDQGQLEEATACYRHAVRIHPRSATAHYNLANALKDQGQAAEAAQCYRQTLACDPRHADACNNLGITLFDQGKPAEAVECYRQALRLNPQHADAHNNLGSALMEQGQLAEATHHYRQAVRANPLLAAAHVNLGNVLVKQGQANEAIVCYRQALRINPNQVDVCNNLGIALEGRGDLTEAIAVYRQALKLRPDHADAHHNLSVALMPLAQFREAREHNQQALRINPAYTAALWQRALLRLQEGDFAGGWRDYEHRWALPNKAAPIFQEARWTGTSLKGQTILVYAEQGLGDTIQFARYLPMVKERGGTVLFQSQPALVRLCATVAGADQVIAVGAALPAFDVRVPLLSLPEIFGTTLTTVPAAVPYFRANPILVERWKQELEPLGGFKVGIVWRGNPKNGGDRYRSIPLKSFEALARIEQVRLVSLQVGPGADQLAAAPFPVTDLGKRFDPSSLDDLAAALMNLDLIVTMETAVAHLAGALGVPVWTLLALSPDWRWLLDRADSPWYPTMRLFRQIRFADWDSLFRRVAADLELNISEHSRGDWKRQSNLSGAKPQID
jgi:tetratricopeptide (TPR) repeat protein